MRISGEHFEKDTGPFRVSHRQRVKGTSGSVKISKRQKTLRKGLIWISEEHFETGTGLFP